MTYFRPGLAAALAVSLLAAPLHAQEPAQDGARSAQRQSSQAPRAEPAASERLKPLPPNSTTQHRIAVEGGELVFSAVAGAIRLYDAQQGAPQADIAFISFSKEGEDAARRPVTFVFNGGPGYASAWLNLGALGPWRLPMDAQAAYPSAPPVTIDNPETWLTFTDLVFIDPPATGYSRILGSEEARKRFFSVDGDIDVLAATIRRWIEDNGRMVSPHFIAGESYGGFRTPKIAHSLQTDQGFGVSGLVMISPVLDFGRFNARYGLLDQVARLPSYAASARLVRGETPSADWLAGVEAYARGDYLADLMRGPRDAAAMERLTARVSELTGFDPSFVRRYGARIPPQIFLRELYRPEQRVGSQYDATVSGFDPAPFSPRNEADDQMRLGLHAPIVSAMLSLYQTKLNWRVEGARYSFISEQASRQWDWGRGNAEAMTDLRQALALDPHMRALTAHGMTDVVTPYYESKMLLEQLPAYGSPDRMRFSLYPGGHMFYSREDSRRRFRDDARALYENR